MGTLCPKYYRKIKKTLSVTLLSWFQALWNYFIRFTAAENLQSCRQSWCIKKIVDIDRFCVSLQNKTKGLWVQVWLGNMLITVGNSLLNSRMQGSNSEGTSVFKEGFLPLSAVLLWGQCIQKALLKFFFFFFSFWVLSCIRESWWHLLDSTSLMLICYTAFKWTVEKITLWTGAALHAAVANMAAGTGYYISLISRITLKQRCWQNSCLSYALS